MTYAHSVEGKPESDWELLEDHLQLVAEGRNKLPGAAGFAAAYDAEDWGRAAGLWHDLGKYQIEFQDYLRGKHPGVEHAGLGASLVQSRRSRIAAPLCFVIAGHHTGLANAQSNESAVGYAEGLPTPLRERLTKNQPLLERLRPSLPDKLLNIPLPPAWSRFAGLEGTNLKLATEFWTRMLFSVLVDADRLATAFFEAKHKPALLHEALVYDSIPDLRNRLDAHVDQLAALAEDTPVNRLRSGILRACRRAAAWDPGLFSLTVPTGGGKTLSAMSFALNHACSRGGQPQMRRVIVVLPFTSIIEQNAAVYRRVLGEGNVLEHHSDLDEEKLEETDSEREARRKLAAENWDAPVVVTTSVQFFESLFSNHPSRCRKLHNIARSVIIFDEVQTLPPQLLAPIIDGLRELTDRYGCSIVLSTATPPALVKTEKQDYGLDNVREIIPDPASLAQRARRVNVSWETDGPISYETLAERLAQHERVLAIVHRRRDARELADLLQAQCPNEPVRHLSALMCPAHRCHVLRQIRVALRRQPTCRVVATQLVEAGVDVDFPVVYRALAGVDSLAQAAGRCDREGKLTEANGGTPGGQFIVFRAPTDPPPGVLRKALDSTLTLRGLRGELDPFDPATNEDFFRELYGKHDLDQHGIQLDRRNLDFATVSAKFRMIDGAARPVVVPYADAMDRAERFRQEPSRKAQRALQPFLVQVSPSHRAALLAVGAIETIDERVDILRCPFWNRYDANYGLSPDIDAVWDPEVSVT